MMIHTTPSKAKSKPPHFVRVFVALSRNVPRSHVKGITFVKLNMKHSPFSKLYANEKNPIYIYIIQKIDNIVNTKLKLFLVAETINISATIHLCITSKITGRTHILSSPYITHLIRIRRILCLCIMILLLMIDITG